MVMQIYGMQKGVKKKDPFYGYWKHSMKCLCGVLKNILKTNLLKMFAGNFWYFKQLTLTKDKVIKFVTWWKWWNW